MTADAETPAWISDREPGEGDCRKLVTLEKGGMKWVGIRAWHADRRCWLNNGVLAQDTVLAWQELPTPFGGPDGLMTAMPGPTLPAGDGQW